MNSRKKNILVCTVVGFLGLLSAVLGFVAEAKRIKGAQVQFSSPSECVYPRSPALALGLTAAVCLMIAQVVINVATGCICCCRRGPRSQPQSSTSNWSWTLSIVCFVVSWFTFVIAFLLLLMGAALNDEHGEEENNMYFGSYNCYVVKPGVFGGAASLSLASVVLGIIYYYLVSLTATKELNGGGSGIVMGQDPVFVHEDTYARRQANSS